MVYFYSVRVSIYKEKNINQMSLAETYPVESLNEASGLKSLNFFLLVAFARNKGIKNIVVI